jgi:hypothetical protein
MARILVITAASLFVLEGPVDFIFWALITTFLDVNEVSVLLAGPFFNLPTLITFF